MRESRGARGTVLLARARLLGECRQSKFRTVRMQLAIFGIPPPFPAPTASWCSLGRTRAGARLRITSYGESW